MRWLLRFSVALNGLLGLALARRLRRRVMIRTGKIRAPQHDFAALAKQQFAPAEPGCVALVGDSQVALAPWLELLTNYRNRGLPGATIADLGSWIDDVLAAEPAQLVLMIGSNDVHMGVPRADSLADARRLLDHVAERVSCPVTVLSVPPLAVGTRAAHALNAGLEKIVTEHGFQWLDITTTLAGMPWSDDGLHLNAAAYRAVAPALRAALERA